MWTVLGCRLQNRDDDDGAGGRKLPREGREMSENEAHDTAGYWLCLRARYHGGYETCA